MLEHVRVVGSDRVVPLRERSVDLGAAAVVWTGAEWVLDARSARAVIDGTRIDRAFLEPGLELTIDGTRYTAESPATARLRALVLRSRGYVGDVDNICTSIWRAFRTGTPLKLAGQDDLIAIALEVHQRICPTRPFILIDPSRRTSDATARGPAARPTLAAAHATGATLCIQADRPPADLDRLHIFTNETSRRLVISCNPSGVDAHLHAVALRPGVIDRAIDELCDESPSAWRPSESDRHWLRRCATSHGELMKAVVRLRAIRCSSSISEAARSLCMSYPALRQWLQNRGLQDHLGSDTDPSVHITGL